MGVHFQSTPWVVVDFFSSSKCGQSANQESKSKSNFMAKHQIWNIGKANAEISAADAAINPLLETAKITSIKVDGKDMAASDAPLADKITALAAVNKPGAGNMQLSDMVVNNDIIAKKLEETSAALAVSQTSVATLQRDNSQLSTDLATSQASVRTLTASNAELENRLKVSNGSVADLTGQLNGINTEISKLCVVGDVLDLKLSKGASEAQKMDAANLVPVADKLKAYAGAVNAAIARTGASVGAIPGVPPAGGAAPAKKEVKGAERMKAAIKIQGFSK